MLGLAITAISWHTSKRYPPWFLFFFLKDPAPTEISPLPLHAALPISAAGSPASRGRRLRPATIGPMPSRFAPEPPFRHDQPQRTAVLLCNLGTPDAPTAPAVRRYLAQFLGDDRVVEIPRIA